MGLSLTRLFQDPIREGFPFHRSDWSSLPDTTLSSLGTRSGQSADTGSSHSTRPLHENRTKIPPNHSPSPTPTHAYILGALAACAEAGSVAVSPRSWQVWEPRPIPRLRAQHHGQFPAPGAHSGPGEAEGPRPSFGAGGAGQPFQEAGPQGLTARGQLGLGGAEVGREPVRRHAVVGEVTRAGRMGAALAMPPSRFVYSDIQPRCFSASPRGCDFAS